MFEMKIEKQLNLRSITAICGKPKYNAVPQVLSIGGKEYKVVGISLGVPLPYMSLEIERTEDNLEGLEINEE